MKHQPHVTFPAQALPFRVLMNMYEKFKAEDNHDPYDYLPLLVFSAFTIEAYINSLGSRRIAFWGQLEKLSWKAKIEVLHSSVGQVADWGREPLQFASQIFRARDRLAHGKDETVSGPLCDDHHAAVSMLYVQHLKPSIFDWLSRDWVTDSSERLYGLLEYLAALFRLSSDDFSTFSHSRVERHDVA